jgi:hypothetical protein
MVARKKPRKIRGDILVKNLEKRMGVGEGVIKNPGGRNARGDKKLATIRKEAAKKTARKTSKKKR